jgi:hypothetical protein
MAGFKGARMSTKQKPWRDLLPIHPAAEKLPLMSAEQLREHADDIAKNGLLVPVVLLERNDESTVVLLDGRNTLDALALLGCKIFPTKRGETENHRLVRGYEVQKYRQWTPFPGVQIRTSR